MDNLKACKSTEILLEVELGSYSGNGKDFLLVDLTDLLTASVMGFLLVRYRLM
jgi:hypothetical protein